jgi:hypothetical protein
MKLLNAVPNISDIYDGQDHCIHMSLTKEQFKVIRKIAISKGYAKSGRQGSSIGRFCKLVILEALKNS